ncbi:hypothetical protein HK100_000957 [Physocladia obscura]|uniref:Uncharacterized protein n=1 Tax=Physocladia obscura TaxID=109957 RepID=A0AAD5TDN9_9FUNG|nr:hypothetical protein HK100_000957 [Physocladia obscura]
MVGIPVLFKDKNNAVIKPVWQWTQSRLKRLLLAYSRSVLLPTVANANMENEIGIGNENKINENYNANNSISDILLELVIDLRASLDFKPEVNQFDLDDDTALIAEDLSHSLSLQIDKMICDLSLFLTAFHLNAVPETFAFASSSSSLPYFDHAESGWEFPLKLNDSELLLTKVPFHTWSADYVATSRLDENRTLSPPAFLAKVLDELHTLMFGEDCSTSNTAIFSEDEKNAWHAMAALQSFGEFMLVQFSLHQPFHRIKGIAFCLQLNNFQPCLRFLVFTDYTPDDRALAILHTLQNLNSPKTSKERMACSLTSIPHLLINKWVKLNFFSNPFIPNIVAQRSTDNISNIVKSHGEYSEVLTFLLNTGFSGPDGFNAIVNAGINAKIHLNEQKRKEVLRKNKTSQIVSDTDTDQFMGMKKSQLPFSQPAANGKLPIEMILSESLNDNSKISATDNSNVPALPPTKKAKFLGEPSPPVSSQSKSQLVISSISTNSKTDLAVVVPEGEPNSIIPQVKPNFIVAENISKSGIQKTDALQQLIEIFQYSLENHAYQISNPDTTEICQISARSIINVLRSIYKINQKIALYMLLDLEKHLGHLLYEKEQVETTFNLSRNEKYEHAAKKLGSEILIIKSFIDANKSALNIFSGNAKNSVVESKEQTLSIGISSDSRNLFVSTNEIISELNSSGKTAIKLRDEYNFICKQILDLRNRQTQINTSMRQYMNDNPQKNNFSSEFQVLIQNEQQCTNLINHCSEELRRRASEIKSLETPQSQQIQIQSNQSVRNIMQVQHQNNQRTDYQYIQQTQNQPIQQAQFQYGQNFQDQIGQNAQYQTSQIFPQQNNQQSQFYILQSQIHNKQILEQNTINSVESARSFSHASIFPTTSTQILAQPSSTQKTSLKSRTAEFTSKFPANNVPAKAIPTSKSEPTGKIPENTASSTIKKRLLLPEKSTSVISPTVISTESNIATSFIIPAAKRTNTIVESSSTTFKNVPTTGDAVPNLIQNNLPFATAANKSGATSIQFTSHKNQKKVPHPDQMYATPVSPRVFVEHFNSSKHSLMPIVRPDQVDARQKIIAETLPIGTKKRTTLNESHELRSSAYGVQDLLESWNKYLKEGNVTMEELDGALTGNVVLPKGFVGFDIKEDKGQQAVKEHVELLSNPRRMEI